MNDYILDFMKLQSDIRMKLIERGVSEELTFDLAGDLLHIAATSAIVDEEYEKAYRQLLDKEDTP